MMDRDRLGLLLACFALACPAPGGDGGASETDGEDSTGSTSGNTLPTTMTSTSSMSGTTTTDPATTEPGTTVESESMSSSSTGNPGGDGCCDPHGGPGCNEPDVETCVCKTLPECCVFEWDQPCVDAAMMDCEATCMAVDTGDTEPADCELQQIELTAADDAVLSGDWYVTDSQIKGVPIAAVSPPDTAGSVLFTVPIPCMATWYVWVRAIDAGEADTLLATLDGEPDPPAIFEIECTDEPFGNAEYRWTMLNWRDNADPMNPGPPCEYVEDPWTADWDEGDHTIEFAYRDSYALSRIIVTNDPDFTPE